MRFDDVLGTVLAADTSSDFGRESLWRQLVDLIGRRRAPAADEALARLRELQRQVPAAVRAASARALELANPPAALVALFAGDELNIALPVLRSARLTSEEWTMLLPGLSPPARSVLRHRRDLGPAVRRALESFGASDFVLGSDVRGSGEAVSDAPVPIEAAAPAPDQPDEIEEEAPPEPIKSPFLPVGDVTRNMPIVAEAFRKSREGRRAREARADTEDKSGDGPFRIADVVARIDAYQREHGTDDPGTRRPQRRAERFRFECDRAGVIRWVEGVERAALIGVSLAVAEAGATRVDAGVTGAFRKRAGFSNARMEVVGRSDAGGDWLISGTPLFDRRSGRFTGYRGAGRRPRPDERAEAPGERRRAAAQSLRQLVHELRTPAGAISGFAEMIEAQLFGPVPDQYRDQASDIRKEARTLLGVIDDLDLSARIDDASLELKDGCVALGPMLGQIAGDLTPLARLRGAEIEMPDTDVMIAGDARAVERLLARLLATLTGVAGEGERIRGKVVADADGTAVLRFDRPAALPQTPGEAEEDDDDRVVLGTGFSLRLARNLATELGGNLKIGAKRLTLRLPAVEDHGVDRAQTS